MCPCVSDVVDIKVLVVDGSDSVRNDLSKLFHSEPGFLVVAAVGDRADWLNSLKVLAPDVMIMDPQTRDLGSQDAFEDIRRLDRTVGIVSFGVFAPDSVRTGSGHADGILQKDCEPAELVAMVRRLARITRERRGASAG